MTERPEASNILRFATPMHGPVKEAFRKDFQERVNRAMTRLGWRLLTIAPNGEFLWRHNDD